MENFNAIGDEDHTTFELLMCRKPSKREFKKVNEVSIFTFFEVFLILFLASHNFEK